ncbi:MAG TPA: type II toxin-antitoxin system RelE/ParE family toxin [Burkholderiaceae bacterium]|nr:type II toxin-antitoxin system RelE/ParE family toxin [Burkholderiaceae bacterium]
MIAYWRPRAERDLDALIRYIAQHNVRAAIELDLHVEKIVALLEENPHLGHRRNGGEILEFLVSSNIRLLYRIRPRLDSLEIVRLIHTRRNYP